MNCFLAGLSKVLNVLGPMRLLGVAVLLGLCAFLALTHPVRAWELFSLIVFGAVSGTYLNPPSVVTQTTATPITAAQALATNRVSVQITATADADTTTGALTHAFGVPATNSTGFSLAGGAPVCLIEPLIVPAGLASMWWVSAKAANTATFTKNTATGSGNASPQVNIHMLRHSILDC